MILALTSTIKSIDCRYTSIDPSRSVLEPGVTEDVSPSDSDLIRGGGAQDAGACVSEGRFT